MVSEPVLVCQFMPSAHQRFFTSAWMLATPASGQMHPSLPEYGSERRTSRVLQGAHHRGLRVAARRVSLPIGAGCKG
jgi:hypothetical protein